MHSNKRRSPVFVERFRTASMHTVVTVRHSAALSSEKFSLCQIHTTFKGGGSVKQTESTETVRAR